MVGPDLDGEPDDAGLRADRQLAGRGGRGLQGRVRRDPERQAIHPAAGHTPAHAGQDPRITTVHWIKHTLEASPEIALFLCLALGFAVGKVKVKKLSLGGIAGTLIVAIFIGMIGKVALNDEVKNIAFAMFIFTLGYISGPSFFASLNRRSLKYFTFTGIEVVSVLVVTAAATKILNLDVGTAAGLMAGGAP